MGVTLGPGEAVRFAMEKGPGLRSWMLLMDSDNLYPWKF